MDEIKIEKMWQDFLETHSARAIKHEQQLFVFPDKKKVYSIIEDCNDLSIIYTYKFHSFDPIGGGSLLRIAIPVVTQNSFLISKPSLMRRFLYNQTIIKRGLSNTFNISPEITNNLRDLFKNHPDLKVYLGPSEILFGVIKPGEGVLDMRTKCLPTTYRDLENLRNVLLEIFYYLSEREFVIPENSFRK